MPRRLPPRDPAQIRSISGKALPHDLDTERVVIAECLFRPAKLDDVASLVAASDFFHPGHAAIWAALVELRTENVPIDVTALGSRLRDHGQLEAVGGTPYLAQIAGDTPAAAQLEPHAHRMAELSRKRRVIIEMQTAIAEGYHEVSPDWLSDVARRVTDAADVKRQRGAIQNAWRQLDPALLSVAPSPDPLLLRHPTRDGQPCGPQQGDGMLPLGTAGLLVSEGGVGKTLALIQLAVSIITGRPWLGHFEIAHEARGGRVLLALGEEKLHQVHRRLWSVCEAYRLTQEERELVLQRLIVLPLAGQPVATLAAGPEGLIETPELLALRSMLRSTAVSKCPACKGAVPAGLTSCPKCRCGVALDRGWSLVVLDPLARWSGPDCEADNTAATRFVQVAESLTEVPGSPVVIVAHHSSKTARREGKVDSRGATGLTDGVRWCGTMRSQRGDVMFVQSKSNVSRPMVEELRLVRIEGGVLRVPTVEEKGREEHLLEERTAEREAKKEQMREALIARKMQDILDAVRTSTQTGTPVPSRKALTEMVPGSKGPNETAVTRLIQSGALIKSGAGYVVAPAPGSNGAADVDVESSDRAHGDRIATQAEMVMGGGF